MKVRMIMLLLLTALCVPFITVGATPRGTETARRMMEEVMAIQNNPSLQGQEDRDTRKAEIKTVIVKNFNFDEMVQESLGRYYGSLSKPQLTEFKAVFQELFLDSYSPGWSSILSSKNRLPTPERTRGMVR